MNSPDNRRPTKDWSYWLGRFGLWVVAGVFGFFAGVLLGGLIHGSAAALALVGLIGLSFIAAGWAGSTWSPEVRDLLFGFGGGQIAGSGFVLTLLSALPSC
jgi:hypothetical protein